MTNINISIREEAYQFLKSLKTGNRSFSDIILGFKKVKSKDNLMSFFGAMHDMKIDWYTKEKTMKEFRSSFGRRITKTIEDMERIRK